MAPQARRPARRLGYWLLAVAVSLLIVSAGCGSAGVVGAPPALTAALPTLSAPLPTPERTDVAGAAPIPIATGGSAGLPPAPPASASPPAPETPGMIQARSPRVEPGRAYDFLLNLDCGASLIIDFDGSFWTWLSGGWPHVAMGQPFQPGTLTLTGPDEARFDYPGGVLRFQRHRGPLPGAGLCM